MAHGRYTIVGKLADGGMAEIFLATQHGAEGFEKPVVLKRVLSAFSADPQFRNMFLDEAHISMGLSHGNIVQVLDVGLSGDRTFLVLELVEGWDLSHIMERAQATGPEHPWPPSLALHVTAQLCRALAYAHSKRSPDGRPLGIVHRDVNPTNVLISEQGEVKLADFGIAKAERKREQTAAGIIKGKIGFMSPEQASGKPLDARADLFSVGTMMYLMLTGRRPFEAGAELESLLRAQRAEYKPPEELNRYLTRETTDIVNRAMRRDPAARYQTADEMLIDVERVLRSQYNSAGQTELKLWLAELARRDGVVPMGRRAVVGYNTAAPVKGVEPSSDLSAGASVELSDVGVGEPQETVVSAAAIPGAALPTGARLSPGLTPPPARVTPLPLPRASARVPAVPPPLPAVPPPLPALAPPPPPAPVARSASIILPGRLTRKSRIGVGFVLGALCMLGAVYGIKWLAAWAGREGIVIPHVIEGQPDAATAKPESRLAEAPGTAGASGGVAPSNGVAQGESPKAPPSAETAPGAAPVDAEVAAAPSGVAEPAERAPAASEDEEELLGHVNPDAAAVIGEDEADQPPPSVSHKEPRKPAPTPAAHPPAPVLVRITSSPLGAVVRTKKQVLGRTPIAIHFNPGNTYELTFVKAGFVTTSRMVGVAATGKPRSVSVPMKKVPPPPPRRGLLRGR